MARQAERTASQGQGGLIRQGVARSSPESPSRRRVSSAAVRPARTDFKGYEGKYVATDTRTGLAPEGRRRPGGQVVIADEDLKVVLEKTRKLDHAVVGGRVPHVDEPIYVGLG